jgi:hypothetical protein
MVGPAKRSWSKHCRRQGCVTLFLTQQSLQSGRGLSQKFGDVSVKAAKTTST